MNETLFSYNGSSLFDTKCSLLNVASKEDFYNQINTTFGENVIENNVLKSNFKIIDDATYGNGISIVYGNKGTSDVSNTENPSQYQTNINNKVYFQWIERSDNLFSVKNLAKPSKIILKCRYSGYGNSNTYLNGWGLKFIGEQTGTCFIPFSMIDMAGTPGYWGTQAVAHLFNNLTEYINWSNNAVNGFMRYDDTFIIDDMDKMFTTDDTSFTMAYSCPNTENNVNLYIEQLDVEF